MAAFALTANLTMAAVAQQGANGLGFSLGLEESLDGYGDRVADAVAAAPTVVGVFDLQHRGCRAC